MIIYRVYWPNKDCVSLLSAAAAKKRCLGASRALISNQIGRKTAADYLPKLDGGATRRRRRRSSELLYSELALILALIVSIAFAEVARTLRA